jgi:hypothetical protein
MRIRFLTTVLVWGGLMSPALVAAADLSVEVARTPSTADRVSVGRVRLVPGCYEALDAELLHCPPAVDLPLGFEHQVADALKAPPRRVRKPHPELFSWSYGPH